MMAGTPPHREVIFSLAEEVRQTMAWLDQEDNQRAFQPIRDRLLSLREAAAMAKLSTVETALTALDQLLPRPEDGAEAAIPLPIEELLLRLASLANALVGTQTTPDLLWLSRLQQIEHGLELLSLEIKSGSNRLQQISCLADRSLSAASDPERTALLKELGQEVNQVLAHSREVQHQFQAMAGELKGSAQTISRILAATHKVLLAPALAAARDRVRRLGRETGKPASLQYRAAGIEIGVNQLEPLIRLLGGLSAQRLRDGIEEPEQRRNSKKATVATLRAEASSTANVISCVLDDDGRSERPPLELSEEQRKDLLQLRARLIIETKPEGGQRWLLQFPAWPGVAEVVALATPGGEVLVPLEVIAEAYDRAVPVGFADLPRILLGKNPDGEVEGGLVLALGGWQAVLSGTVMGTSFFAVLSPPDSGDPFWVWGQAASGSGNIPVFHPLPCSGLADGQVCLFPPDWKHRPKSRSLKH